MKMITNLFSVFDPASSLGVPVNWIRALLFIVVITPVYWVNLNKSNIVINKVIYKLHIEFKTLLGPGSLSGSTIITIRLFLFIVINNFIGLFPYVFTASRHIALTLAFSLPIWLSFIIFGWINYTKHIFAHIVPQRTPSLLIPFIVLIETISNVIRPLTLAVRLIANIVAGHLLITLLGNQTAVSQNFILVSLLIAQIILLTLESAVAVIQAYVFSVLSTLYASEITTH